ncbi:glucokinase [Craurococcus roseus]|uniref:Glucokinase n=1 Tax=Craurococcus roseus TaxID=77585 RepID=A0ABN1ESL3_9PROT
MAEPLLIADIGGTNARFALLDEGTGSIGPLHRVKLDDFSDVAGAISAFLAAHAEGRTPSGAVLAAAGPVSGNRARLTNRGWAVDGAKIASALGIRAVRVVNDFAAMSRSLPELTPADLFPLGGGAGEPGEPMAVLGPGTGLGVGAFLPPDRILVTEGGHASLAATCPREAAVIGWLRARHGHVSAERALSGMGLANLHSALAAIDGVQTPRRDAAAVTAAGLSGECALCREALCMFCALLGAVAGDLALLYGARGGVFVAGGIPPRFPQFIAESEFRARFEAKGRFSEWLRPVPAYVVTRLDASMLGLAALARRL